MLDPYKHHVFVSHSRSGDVPEWLYNHFVPVLTNQLEGLLDEDPTIFVDKNIDVGSEWPAALADAHLHSCCLIAIWTPRYFRSKWCIAEWKTMLTRQQNIAGNQGNEAPRLTYPILYSDGESFPEEAKRIQYMANLTDYNYPYPVFRNSERYLLFHDLVRSVAADIAKMLKQIPPWDASWEVLKPALEYKGPTQFTRL